MNTERLADIINKISEKSDDYTLYRSDEVRQEVLDACNELGRFFDDENLDGGSASKIDKETLGRYGVDLYSLSNYVDFENLEDVYDAVFLGDDDYVKSIQQRYFDEELDASSETANGGRRKFLYGCDDCGYEVYLYPEENTGACPNCGEHHGFYSEEEFDGTLGMSNDTATYKESINQNDYSMRNKRSAMRLLNLLKKYGANSISDDNGSAVIEFDRKINDDEIEPIYDEFRNAGFFSASTPYGRNPEIKIFADDRMLPTEAKLLSYDDGLLKVVISTLYLGDTDEINEVLELPTREPESTAIPTVDLIKKAYDSGKFNNLKCVGRDNACTFDIHGPDKERIISFFDKKSEFNREDHNDSGINSVEFISDKFDIEIFDNFIRVYKIPQNESAPLSDRIPYRVFVKGDHVKIVDGGKTGIVSDVTHYPETQIKVNYDEPLADDKYGYTVDFGFYYPDELDFIDMTKKLKNESLTSNKKINEKLSRRDRIKYISLTVDGLMKIGYNHEEANDIAIVRADDLELDDKLSDSIEDIVKRQLEYSVPAETYRELNSKKSEKIEEAVRYIYYARKPYKDNYMMSGKHYNLEDAYIYALYNDYDEVVKEDNTSYPFPMGINYEKVYTIDELKRRFPVDLIRFNDFLSHDEMEKAKSEYPGYKFVDSEKETFAYKFLETPKLREAKGKDYKEYYYDFTGPDNDKSNYLCHVTVRVPKNISMSTADEIALDYVQAKYGSDAVGDMYSSKKPDKDAEVIDETGHLINESLNESKPKYLYANPIMQWAVAILYDMDNYVLDVYDNEEWLVYGVPDGEFEETTRQEVKDNYTDHEWLISDFDGNFDADKFKEFLDTFKSSTSDKSDYDDIRGRQAIIDEAEQLLKDINKTESLKEDLEEFIVDMDDISDFSMTQHKVEKLFNELSSDIKTLSKCENIDDVKNSEFNIYNCENIIERYTEKGLNFDDAVDKMLSLLFSTKENWKKDLEQIKDKSRKSDVLYNKIKDELGKEYPIIEQLEGVISFRAPENATQDDCIEFTDKVVKLVNGRYHGTGRGGSWSIWDILTDDGLLIHAGWGLNDSEFQVKFPDRYTDFIGESLNEWQKYEPSDDEVLFGCDDCGSEFYANPDTFDWCCPNCHEHHGIFRFDEDINNSVKDVSVYDTVILKIPGNSYNGRVGVVDYIDDRTITVKFKDGLKPETGNYSHNQVRKLNTIKQEDYIKNFCDNKYETWLDKVKRYDIYKYVEKDDAYHDTTYYVDYNNELIIVDSYYLGKDIDTDEDSSDIFNFEVDESYKSGDRYYGGLPQEPSDVEYGNIMTSVAKEKQKFIKDNNISVEKDDGSVIYSGKYNGHSFVYSERTSGFSHWAEFLIIDRKKVDLNKSTFGYWAGFMSETNKGSLYDVIQALKDIDNTDDENYIVFKGEVTVEESFEATAPSISDLKSFFNTSDTLRAKYANFFEWFDDMVKSGKFRMSDLRNESCDKISESVDVNIDDIERRFLNGELEIVSVDEEDYDKYNFISDDNFINIGSVDLSQGTGNVIRTYYYDVNTDKVYAYTDF